uniref:Uncharacterized protein n=1 Tax=Grammatophora oceanica TaxID=210454 RepID=A0A7S1Y2K8_9STRA|mmetsp:Transcript_13167/g.19402  ORF Transcript_13167/g.19402 Transcript_13167/m.19402 type:complete len:110 (+) Transcript_13167:15-344(+)
MEQTTVPWVRSSNEARPFLKCRSPKSQSQSSLGNWALEWFGGREGASIGKRTTVFYLVFGEVVKPCRYGNLVDAGRLSREYGSSSGQMDHEGRVFCMCTSFIHNGFLLH